MLKKIIIFLIILAGLILGYFFGKNKLIAFLLTRQLTSETEVTRIMAQSNQPLNPETKAVFNNEPVPYLSKKAKLLTSILSAQEQLNQEYSNVLGAESDRWIEVNLTQQRVYAWEGGNQVGNYLVSTGLYGRTPTGDFKIWTKLAKTTMSGGSKALGTYYYLPNVPCTMYFYKGYGLHGTYWHNNFGHPMSHGCVNMKTDEACTLFAWASVGTRVNVHY